MINYNPIPILFQIGNLKVYSYGTMLAIAFLLALIFMLRDAKKQGIAKKHILNIWFLALIGGIAGARLLYVSLNFSYYLANPLEIFHLWHGGIASYGGLFLALLFVYIYIKKSKLNFAEITNIIAPYLALGFAIARIGCFLNWDDFGLQSSLPWAISTPNDIPRHPTQLYLSALDFILFLGLMKINKTKENLKNKRPKARILKIPTLVIFFFFFAVIRLTVEPLRVYDTKNYNILSIIINLILLLATSVYAIKKIKK